MKKFSFFIGKVFFLSILIVVSFSIYSMPQNRPQVTLAADRDDVQQWERVNIKASLNYNDPSASYGFFINSEPVTIGVSNNEIIDYEFQKTGSFLIKVFVKGNQTLTRNNPLLTDSILINVRKVSLSVDRQEVFIDERVTFKLGYKLPQNYVRYRFNFGDNSQSEWLSESLATHTYEHNGNYRVLCEIGKFDGETLYASIQSEIKQVFVKIKETYEVKLSAITYATVDEDIKFTATPITNAQNQNFRYQFDFGDNTDTSANSKNQSEHSYRRTGSYKASVKLLTRENKLLAESNIVTITVQALVILPKSISFIVNPVEVNTNEKVTFKLELQNINKNLRYRFHYGQNMKSSHWLTKPESNYKYERPDNYDVYAEVGRFDGDSVYSLVKSETKLVKVKPNFKVSLSAPASVHVGDSIIFKTEISTNSENQVFRFQFDFGDLTPAATQSKNEIQHSFIEVGTFDARVKLLTRDGKLLATSDILRIKVNDIVIPPETVSLIVAPMEVNADEEVNFKLELQTAYQNLRYRFYYGNGAQFGDWLDIPESRYKYERPDTYEVYAEVGRFDGDSVYSLLRTETKQVKVNPFFEVRISSETSGKVDEEITFKAEAITNIVNPDYRFLFDFGDSNKTKQQTESSATHRYVKEGKYIVTVRLINNQGEIVAVSSSNILIEQPANIFIYILLALCGLIGGSLTLKYLLKPKLKLQPKSDIGMQSVTKGKESLIDLAIRINPNFNQAKLNLDTSNKNLIDKARRIK